MLDTMAVADELWQTVLPTAMRSWISLSLGLAEGDDQRWCSFLAGAHDLGKASPVFQQKGKTHIGLLESSGLQFPRYMSPVPHGTISAVSIEPFFMNLGMPRPAARTAATIIGGHHGTFPTIIDLQQARSTPRSLGNHFWEELRTHFLRKLREVVAVSKVPSALTTPVAMALAGFVSISDWIASDEDHFPLANSAIQPAPVVWAEYERKARTQAGEAIRDLGWSLVRPNSPLPSFTALFPGLRSATGEFPTPNNLQQHILEHLPRTNPQILVLEAPMGEGKTEAALLAADALGPRGFYVALPTQATSNQAFARVSDFLRRRYPESPVHLQLLHGHASLSEEVKTLRENATLYFRPAEGDREDLTDVGSPVVLAAEWFTSRKRGLLAPYGVGTIDQVLLADLATRHVFVRLFGLAHKAVILDEVHAYDTYMTHLAEGLVEWLGALGASIILLSATLPKARRESLIRAYLRGRGIDEPPPIPSAPYPRLTWAGNQDSGSRQVITSLRNRRTIHLGWISPDLPRTPQDGFQIGAKLQELLVDGGLAAVICNTVRRAQEMFGALCSIFPRDELGLLHAQFPLSDRRLREERCARVFGKERDPRVHRSVLVATQVIEQSLDLDFDLIITDFAPADLMIQRSGRLHRHPREYRPPNLKEPRLFVCRPLFDEHGVPSFENPDARVYDARVYDDFILLRTWLAWEPLTTLSVPGDLERIVEKVYAEEPPPDTLSSELRSRWETARNEHFQEQTRQRYQAGIREIGRPNANGLENIVSEPREEEDSAQGVHAALQALTRLARPSQPIIVLDSNWDKPIEGDGSRGPLTNEATAALLDRSLTLTHVGAALALWRNDDTCTPPNWKRNPLLRNYRLLRLDTHGEAVITMSKYRVRLDSELGLQVLSE